MVEVLECPVCKENKFNKIMDTEDYFFTKEDFSLFECKDCGFVFTNPIPSSEDIGKYYETDKYLSHDSSNKGIVGNIYNKVREINLKRKYNLIDGFKSSGNILDIGCGTGEFLNFMKKNSWDVQGVEPSANARNFAKNNYQIKVDEESFLDQIEDKSMDVVSMWHVLEHVPNLYERMKTLKRVLKDDGVAIIALPMFDSPDSKKFGKYWAGIDVPRHLYHFTAKSFGKLAEKFNFDIVEKKPMKFDALYVSWLSHQAMGKSLSLFRGVMSGMLSNIKADKDKNYSSMIFVIKKRDISK